MENGFGITWMHLILAQKSQDLGYFTIGYLNNLDLIDLQNCYYIAYCILWDNRLHFQRKNATVVEAGIQIFILFNSFDPFYAIWYFWIQVRPRKILKKIWQWYFVNLHNFFVGCHAFYEQEVEISICVNHQLKSFSWWRIVLGLHGYILLSPRNRKTWANLQLEISTT